MTNKIEIPSVSINIDRTGKSKKSNEMGMREMQERAYEKRGEQYLIIKSPPASGKSRALMFIALDKVENQNVKQAIIVVPEKSIGKSFDDAMLTEAGFWADWEVKPKWNLCNSPGGDGGKAKSVKAFLESDDKNLVCTHSTFRFAVQNFGIEIFDNRLIAIDEFHHVSANPDNVLGNQLIDFLERDKVHIVAMTGSYFRGDAEAIMGLEDEAKFQTVTYTYYEQLNGYEYLKELNIGYFFYNGPYVDDILKVLNPNEKTIIHIPSVPSKESTGDKTKEVEHIIEELGDWQGTDPETGFHLINMKDGHTLRVADLVNDDSTKRSKVQASLRSKKMESNRDYVDIIIALNMAKEGFDWIWCEHALTAGYRGSLTEVVQIIGRATRDAPGKERTRFTNLIAEPDASQENVVDAVNDTLKAIAASLLMENVLAPKFEFKAKTPSSGPEDGIDYGEGGYNSDKENVGINKENGQIQIEITGLAEPKSEKAQQICKERIEELTTAFIQDQGTVERGIFDPELIPEETTQIAMGKIVSKMYPDLDDHDKEAVRQHAIAAINITQQVKKVINGQVDDGTEGGDSKANTAIIDGVRRFITDVTSLDVDFIDSISPFGETYSIISKSMGEENLKKLSDIIASKKVNFTVDEAKELAQRALKFKKENGRLPETTSNDPWEKKMAEGMNAYARLVAEAKQNG